jgi:crotonobetainyl-CoA:carnitine CoA-transferase CaiB-like acyl-CoA transferase
MIVETDHPALGRIRSLGSPIKMSGTPPNVRRRAPMLGEHTADILRQAGYSQAEIERLVQLKAVR